MTNHDRLSQGEAFDLWIIGLTDDEAGSESLAEEAFCAGWDYGWQDADEYYRTGGS